MRIRIITERGELAATLEDSPSARDFLTLLPLELMLADYNQTEKIAYLPRKLSTQGAPKGIDPAVGDLTYYAPWENLALFYRDFGYSPGLIRLGKIKGNLDVLSGRDAVAVRVEQLGPFSQ